MSLPARPKPTKRHEDTLALLPYGYRPMNQSVDVAEIIASFKVLVNNKRPGRRYGNEARNLAIPEPRNAFKIKGKQSQSVEPLGRKLHEPREKGHLEHGLHTAIVTHPVLLHTPELYAGGLYLDSILNKLGLPFFRINDFGYITVQGSTVKITLVEIEQAAKPVFHNKITARHHFQSETEEAIGQVRQWQDKLKSESRKRTVLANLKPLFEHYPIELFDENEDPYPWVRIEFGYVLVVGNEIPSHDQHRDLIDDLYINENILFMTYPMMIGMVEQGPHHKNVLKIGAPGIEIITAQNPQSLGSDPQRLSRQSNDPFGIKLAGFGHPAYQPQENVMNPSNAKQAFYRSKGNCEKTGCINKVVSEHGIHAMLMPIYNAYGEHSRGHRMTDAKNIALCCPMHTRLGFNDGERIALGDLHPLNHAMQKSGAYRHDLDIAGTQFMNDWIQGIPDALIEALDINPVTEQALTEQIKSCALALRSLPKWPQLLLENIAKDYYGARYATRIDRSKQAIEKNRNYRFLLRAGLIRVNPLSPPGKEIEPTIFSRELIERIDDTFGERAFFAFSNIFCANTPGLFRDLERARKGRVNLGFASGKPQVSPSSPFRAWF